MWIRIGFNADPNPFYIIADLDPDSDLGSHTNADPDPGRTLKSHKVEFLTLKNNLKTYPRRCQILFARQETGFISKFWSVSMTPGSGFAFPIRIRIRIPNTDPDPQHCMNTFVVIIQEQTMDRIASKAKLEVKRSEEEWGRTFHHPQSSSLGNHIWASSIQLPSLKGTVI
jgi:hypothetical protein